MRSEAVRLAGRCLGLTVASGMATAAGAQQAQTALTVSTGVSAETNAYNAIDGSTGSVAVTAELQPLARFRTERSRLDLRGLAQFRQFVRRYGLEDNYSGNADFSTQPSERLTLRASGAFAYDEGGFGAYGRPGLSPLLGVGTPTTGVSDPLVSAPVTTAPALPNVSVITDPLLPQQQLLTDVSLLGQRTRTKTFIGNAGFDGQLTDRSQLSGDIGARALRFASGRFNDYNNISSELRWNHTLDDVSSLGFIVSADRTDYLAGRSNDTLTKSGLVSYDRRFSSRWALSLGAGASFSTIKQPLGFRDAHLTALNVRGRFCRQGDGSQICVSGQRSPQPSAIGGVRVSDSVAVVYSTRISELENISLSGAYSRTGRGRGVAALAMPSSEFAGGTARYDRRLGERLSFYASGSVSKVFGSLASDKANLGVAAGLSFSLGALR